MACIFWVVFSTVLKTTSAYLSVFLEQLTDIGDYHQVLVRNITQETYIINGKICSVNYPKKIYFRMDMRTTFKQSHQNITFILKLHCAWCMYTAHNGEKRMPEEWIIVSMQYRYASQMNVQCVWVTPCTVHHVLTTKFVEASTIVLAEAACIFVDCSASGLAQIDGSCSFYSLFSFLDMRTSNLIVQTFRMFEESNDTKIIGLV